MRVRLLVISSHPILSIHTREAFQAEPGLSVGQCSYTWPSWNRGMRDSAVTLGHPGTEECGIVQLHLAILEQKNAGQCIYILPDWSRRVQDSAFTLGHPGTEGCGIVCLYLTILEQKSVTQCIYTWPSWNRRVWHSAFTLGHPETEECLSLIHI